MCIAKVELEEKIAEIRKYKTMVEEATNIQKSLEAEIIDYMRENNLTEEFTDEAKITYTSQERKFLNREALENDLGDLSKYTKATTYNVLRIK